MSGCEAHICIGPREVPNAGNYTVRSWVVRFILAIIMIPAAIGSFIMLSAAIVSLNWIVLISGLVWTPLFAAAPSLGFEAARDGRKARKARKLNGLPKPQTSVGDEAARRYFTKHKEAGLEITPGNFPDRQMVNTLTGNCGGGVFQFQGSGLVNRVAFREPSPGIFGGGSYGNAVTLERRGRRLHVRYGRWGTGLRTGTTERFHSPGTLCLCRFVTPPWMTWDK